MRLLFGTRPIWRPVLSYIRCAQTAGIPSAAIKISVAIKFMQGLGRISARMPTGKASIGCEPHVGISYQAVSIDRNIKGGSYGGTGYF